MPDNALVAELKALGLPPDDFAVFGSGPLMARGLIESHDLDIIARGAAWQRARQLGRETAGTHAGRKVELAGGRIEVFDAWGPGAWDPDALIDGADVIDGVRYARLAEVLKWKKMMRRPKDTEHIRLAEAYLAAHPEK